MMRHHGIIFSHLPTFIGKTQVRTELTRVRKSCSRGFPLRIRPSPTPHFNLIFYDMILLPAILYLKCSAETCGAFVKNGWFVFIVFSTFTPIGSTSYGVHVLANNQNEVIDPVRKSSGSCQAHTDRHTLGKGQIRFVHLFFDQHRVQCEWNGYHRMYCWYHSSVNTAGLWLVHGEAYFMIIILRLPKCSYSPLFRGLVSSIPAHLMLHTDYTNRIVDKQSFSQRSSWKRPNLAGNLRNRSQTTPQT